MRLDVFVKNNIFSYLTLKLTFDLEDDLWIEHNKIYEKHQQNIVGSICNKTKLGHL